MLKKSALALFGLIFAVALLAPAQATAQVSVGIGIGVGSPAVIAPPAYGYVVVPPARYAYVAPPYAPYAPTYVYPGRIFVGRREYVRPYPYRYARPYGYGWHR